MPRVSKRSPKSQTPATPIPTPAGPQLTIPLDDGSAMVAMIQALIPLGLQAVAELLRQEVTALAGRRYAHDDDHPHLARWGAQPGSISLADQQLPIQVPRVRDRAAGHEVPLATYHALQTPRALDLGLFRRVLGGLSCRDSAPMRRGCFVSQRCLWDRIGSWCGTSDMARSTLLRNSAPNRGSTSALFSPGSAPWIR